MAKFLDKTGLDTLWAKIKNTFQTLGNKVTNVRATSSASDDKYPSEKAVATALDAKTDKTGVISFVDAKLGKSTVAWYKLAQRAFTTTSGRCNSSWIVTVSDSNDSFAITNFILEMSVKSGASGDALSVLKCQSSPINPSNNRSRLTDTKFRIVVTGTSGSSSIALYCKQGASNIYVSIRELAAGLQNQAISKGDWTYISYNSSTPGETEEPTGSVYKDMNWFFAAKDDHTHGDITDDGKIGSTANLPVITGQSGAVTTGTFATSTVAVSTSSAAGTANTFSRGDHKHSISLGTGDSPGQVKIAGSNVSVNGWAYKSSLGDSRMYTGTTSNVKRWFKFADMVTDANNGGVIGELEFTVERIGTYNQMHGVMSYHFTRTDSTTEGNVVRHFSATILKKSGNTTTKFIFRKSYNSTTSKLTFELWAEVSGSNYAGLVIAERLRKSADTGVGAAWTWYSAPTAESTEPGVPADSGIKVVCVPAVVATNQTPGTAIGSSSVPIYCNTDGTLAACTVDSTPTASSTNLVSSGGVASAIANKQDKFVALVGTNGSNDGTSFNDIKTAFANNQDIVARRDTDSNNKDMFQLVKTVYSSGQISYFVFQRSYPNKEYLDGQSTGVQGQLEQWTRSSTEWVRGLYPVEYSEVATTAITAQKYDSSDTSAGSIKTALDGKQDKFIAIVGTSTFNNVKTAWLANQDIVARRVVSATENALFQLVRTEYTNDQVSKYVFQRSYPVSETLGGVSTLVRGQLEQWSLNTSNQWSQSFQTVEFADNCTNAHTVDNYHLSVLASLPSSYSSDTIYFV